MERCLSKREITLLYHLGKQVSEIAQDPKWLEKENLWKKKNTLQKTRPLILCTIAEAGWDEIISRKSLEIQNPFFRYYERFLKKQIYRSQYLRDDEIIDNKIYVPYVLHRKDWIEGRIRPYDSRPDHSAKFTPCILKTGDLKKLQFPDFEYDEAATKKQYDYVREVFKDSMDVVLGEPFYASTESQVLGWGHSLIDLWCELRGLGTVFYDLYDEPEFTKEAMAFLQEGCMRYLRNYEKLGLVNLNNNGFIKLTNTPLGSNGLGYTDELPSKRCDGQHITLKDVWGYSMAQEFTLISPEMLEEFVLKFQAPLADMFGLNAYGCCENNDAKWDIIQKYIPRIRAVSVPFASSLKTAAEKLGDRFVLCWKPNVVDLIGHADEERLRTQMRGDMETAKKCHMVYALRDAETLFGDIGRATVWTDMAMEMAKEYGE